MLRYIRASSTVPVTSTPRVPKWPVCLLSYIECENLFRGLPIRTPNDRPLKPGLIKMHRAAQLTWLRAANQGQSILAKLGYPKFHSRFFLQLLTHKRVLFVHNTLCKLYHVHCSLDAPLDLPASLSHQARLHALVTPLPCNIKHGHHRARRNQHAGFLRHTY